MLASDEFDNMMAKKVTDLITWMEGDVEGREVPVWMEGVRPVCLPLRRDDWAEAPGNKCGESRRSASRRKEAGLPGKL